MSGKGRARRKTTRIGLDFDGVIAYNPIRVVRAPIKWFKREVLGIHKLSFFLPKNPWQRFWWALAHESSIWPAKGVELLKELVASKQVEVHLITARYGFLEDHLRRWLDKYELTNLFSSINVNTMGQQPHLFKLETVERLNLEFFVEDNLDIVEYMHGKTKTKIFWIYNLLDINQKFEPKFPYLGKALEAIQEKSHQA